MKPGDIVLIRFPQADLKQGKFRPALVIAISPSAIADIVGWVKAGVTQHFRSTILIFLEATMLFK